MDNEKLIKYLKDRRLELGLSLRDVAELTPVKPSEPPQAILALQGLNLSEIYETLTKEEKRRFWRGIIREIRFDKERNFFYIWR